MLKHYPWQDEQWQRFMKTQQQDRMPHAILLCGPDGIGLKHFAQTAIMQLLCLSRDNKIHGACGKCQSCRLYAAGNHPDLYVVEPEEGSKQIKIHQIRELLNYVALKSFSGDLKIAIIEPADAMNHAAANTLLKTLEEPPAQSMLFLLSHRSSKLPITVRSRCQRIDFKPAYDSSAKAWLHSELDEKNQLSKDALLRISGGGPLKALQLAAGERLACRSALVGDLKLMCKENCDPIPIAERWKALGVENMLGWLMKMIVDLIRLKLLREKTELINLDLKKDLQEIESSLDLLALVRNYDIVMLKYQQVTGPMNYNPLSLIEEIVLHWRNPK